MYSGNVFGALHLHSQIWYWVYESYVSSFKAIIDAVGVYSCSSLNSFQRESCASAPPRCGVKMASINFLAAGEEVTRKEVALQAVKCTQSCTVRGKGIIPFSPTAGGMIPPRGRCRFQSGKTRCLRFGGLYFILCAYDSKDPSSSMCVP